MAVMPGRVRTVVRRALLVVAMALVGTALTVPPRSVAAERTAVLIYGDSITHGSSGDYTWRYRLWQDLTASGAAVDFVGPADDLAAVPDGADTHAYADPDFDTDHASRWGMQLGDPAYPLADMVRDYHPDVVVALLGLNDLLYGLHTPAELAQIWSDDIAAARALEPSLSVVLVQQPDVWYPGVEEYNQDLVALAGQLDTPGSRVVASGPIGSDVATDTWDDSHPTATGEVKIATAAADALAGIGLGAPVASPLAVVNGPRWAPELSATPGTGEVTLAWSGVPGVDKVWIERLDPSGGGWVRGQDALGAGTASWTDSGLTDGARYRYRLRPAKGRAISPDVTSNVVTVAPGVPAAPGQVRAQPTADGSVRVSWSPAPPATSYAVGVAGPGRVWSWLPPTSLTRARLTGLRSGGTYVIAVRPANGPLVGARAVVRVQVPRVAAVRHVTVRARARTLTVSGREVAYAQRYRLYVSRQRSCGTRPTTWHLRKVGLHRPWVRRVFAPGSWRVRLVAVRDGVPGTVAPGSSACARVPRHR